MFSLWSCPCFQGLCPSLLSVCRERPCWSMGSWVACSAEAHILSPQCRMRFVRRAAIHSEQICWIRERSGSRGSGGKWWGGLVARWLTYNCSMPVFRAWHSLSVFLFIFCFFPSTSTSLPLPAPPSHQFTCLALLVSEVWIIKWRENRQNRGRIMEDSAAHL